MVKLALAQMRDDAIIEGKCYERVCKNDYRRLRSLKFRAKMRDKRSQLYNDPFFKKDRNIKNLNKVNAAKNRKRDDTGKFNFEERKKDEVQMVALNPPRRRNTSELEILGD